MTPLLAHDLQNRIFSSTTPRPGSLGGGGTLLMMADISPTSVFHSCARMMPMRRRKRALPLIFGGLLTIAIGKLNGYTFLHSTALTTKYYFPLSTAQSWVEKNPKLLFFSTFSKLKELSNKLESKFDAQVITDLVQIFKQMINRIIRNLSKVLLSIQMHPIGFIHITDVRSKKGMGLTKNGNWL